MRLVFGAMAEQRHGLIFDQTLKEPQREFLPVILNSLAISLLRRPETTPFMTSRSRGVNVCMALQISSLSIARFVPVQTWQTKTNFHAICYCDQLKDLAKNEITPSEVKRTRLC